MSERPPLSALIYETLDDSLHKLDVTHWQIITARRIKKLYPPDSPVPSPAPQSLLRDIRSYASILFTSEADLYERVQQNAQYHEWLSGLANRVKERVLTALDRLEDGDPDSMLLGVNRLLKPDVERSLEEMLWEMVRDYSQGRAPSQVSRNRIDGQQPPALSPNADPRAAVEPKQNEREKFVLPILDAKGWSILKWATEANVTKDTATDYLANRTKPYRSTRLKLAKALNVPVQQLPR